MHVQVVNFQLKDISEEQYRTICDEFAPTFSELPDLLAKIWLADSASGTYGGVYLWESRQAFETYKNSELFRGVGAHPNFRDVVSRDFGVLEDPTQVTWRLGVTVPA